MGCHLWQDVPPNSRKGLANNAHSALYELDIAASAAFGGGDCAEGGGGELPVRLYGGVDGGAGAAWVERGCSRVVHWGGVRGGEGVAGECRGDDFRAAGYWADGAEGGEGTQEFLYERAVVQAAGWDFEAAASEVFHDGAADAEDAAFGGGDVFADGDMGGAGHGAAGGAVGREGVVFVADAKAGVRARADGEG